MRLKNKGWLVWIALAYALCLVPSGWLHWVVSVFSRGVGGGFASMSGDLRDWSAHAILMGGAAYSLYRLFRFSVGWLLSLSAAVLLVFLIAASIEWLQGLLPESFHRGPAMSDICASLIGALIGGGLALAVTRRPSIYTK